MILPEILNQNEKDISRNFENKKNIFSNQYAAEYILYKNRGKDEISGRIFDTTENIKYFRNAERLNEQSEKFTKERIEIAPGVQNENGIFCFSFGNIPQFMTAGNLNESFLNEISERRYGFILNGPNENSLYEQQEKIVGNSPERFDVYSESEYGGVSAAEISMREFENNEMPKNKEISDSIEHIYGYEKNAELSGNEKIEIFFENGSIVNNFTKDMDIDDIVDEFAERLREAICSSAEG